MTVPVTAEGEPEARAITVVSVSAMVAAVAMAVVPPTTAICDLFNGRAILFYGPAECLDRRCRGRQDEPAERQ
jgi:hypothetical protein